MRARLALHSSVLIVCILLPSWVQAQDPFAGFTVSGWCWADATGGIYGDAATAFAARCASQGRTVNSIQPVYYSGSQPRIGYRCDSVWYTGVPTPCPTGCPGTTQLNEGGQCVEPPPTPDCPEGMEQSTWTVGDNTIYTCEPPLPDPGTCYVEGYVKDNPICAADRSTCESSGGAFGIWNGKAVCVPQENQDPEPPDCGNDGLAFVTADGQYTCQPLRNLPENLPGPKPPADPDEPKYGEEGGGKTPNAPLTPGFIGGSPPSTPTPPSPPVSPPEPPVDPPVDPPEDPPVDPPVDPPIELPPEPEPEEPPPFFEPPEPFVPEDPNQPGAGGNGGGNGGTGNGGTGNGGSGGNGGGNGGANGGGPGEEPTEEPADRVSGGGNCSVRPSCSGSDPIGCAILQQTWSTRCALEGGPEEWPSDAGEFTADRLKEEVDVSTEFSDVFTPAGITGQCPSPDQITIAGFSLDVQYTPFCDLAGFLRPIVLLLFGLISLRIVMRGFV
jgi:uncharacterized membrane protein YgcG